MNFEQFKNKALIRTSGNPLFEQFDQLYIPYNSQTDIIKAVGEDVSGWFAAWWKRTVEQVDQWRADAGLMPIKYIFMDNYRGIDYVEDALMIILSWMMAEDPSTESGKKALKARLQRDSNGNGIPDIFEAGDSWWEAVANFADQLPTGEADFDEITWLSNVLGYDFDPAQPMVLPEDESFYQKWSLLEQMLKSFQQWAAYVYYTTEDEDRAASIINGSFKVLFEETILEEIIMTVGLSGGLFLASQILAYFGIGAGLSLAASAGFVALFLIGGLITWEMFMQAGQLGTGESLFSHLTGVYFEDGITDVQDVLDQGYVPIFNPGSEFSFSWFYNPNGWDQESGSAVSNGWADHLEELLDPEGDPNVGQIILDMWTEYGYILTPPPFGPQLPGGIGTAADGHTYHLLGPPPWLVINQNGEYSIYTQGVNVLDPSQYPPGWLPPGWQGGNSATWLDHPSGAWQSADMYRDDSTFGGDMYKVWYAPFNDYGYIQIASGQWIRAFRDADGNWDIVRDEFGNAVFVSEEEIDGIYGGDDQDVEDDGGGGDDSGGGPGGGPGGGEGSAKPVRPRPVYYDPSSSPTIPIKNLPQM